MSGLPSPEDIGVKILVWLSVPGLIVTVYTTLLAGLAWLQIVRTGARYVGYVGDWTQRRVRHWTSVRQRALVRLVAASTVFVAFSYSLSQLAGVTYEKVNQHQSIALGMSFDWSFLASRLLQYDHWTHLSIGVVISALASIFALNFADLIGARRLRAFIIFIWHTVLGLGALLSLVLALAGLAVLFQGLMHSGIYKPSMALLYALWVICLWILPLSSIVIDHASKQLYSR